MTYPPQPFVGVCGIQNATEYATLSHRAYNVLQGTNRFLMAGVKQARPDIIPPIAPELTLVRPFVHCTFSEKESFEKTVSRNIALTKEFVRGLQLNMVPWMEVDFAPLWKKLKRRYPHISLMLQAHCKIIGHYSPEAIARRLQGLNVDYILFDSSQSHGVNYDLAAMRQYLAAVSHHGLPIGVVVAGGLSGHNMEALFGPLLQEYPSLSCDAFGRLVDVSKQAISWPAVDSYLAAWSRTYLDSLTYTKRAVNEPKNKSIIAF